MMKLIRGEIITAESKKVKLSDEHIKKLLEKGKQQNNKLCFADVTDMIAGLADFSTKDYDKVMLAINKARIELVDKLAEDEPTAEDLNSMLLHTEETDADVMLEDESALEEYHQ